MSARELVLGSRFSLSAGSEAGAPRAGARGRFARDGFDAGLEDQHLSGGVTTGFLGADAEAGRWFGGAALGSSAAEGPYRMAGGDPHGTFDVRLEAARRAPSHGGAPEHRVGLTLHARW